MLNLIIFSLVFLLFGGLLSLLVYNKYIKGSRTPVTGWISLAVLEAIIFSILVLPSILAL